MRKISHTELTLMGFFHGQASVHSSDGVNDNLIRRAGADIQIRQKFPRLIDTNPVQRLVGYASASDGRVSSAVVQRGLRKQGIVAIYDTGKKYSEKSTSGKLLEGTGTRCLSTTPAHRARYLLTELCYKAHA